jgi:MFS family permease
MDDPRLALVRDDAAVAISDDAADSPPEPVGPQAIPVAARRRILWLMCLLKILTSYDSGAFSASLGVDRGIAEDLRLNIVDEGALGSIVFIGNTIGCAVAGVLFARYDAKAVLTWSMTAHAVASLCFALSPSFAVSLAVRLVVGFTLAFVVVYSVVWADTFAPKERATLWMASMNIGVPIGMLLGFFVGGFMVPHLEASWRWAFLVKVIVMVPAVVMLHRADRATLAEEVDPVDARRAPVAGLERVTKITKSLLRNEMFVCSCAGLIVLYFCITALQTFITPFLRAAPFHASMNTIVFGFGATSVTAPICGVVLGGVLLDRLGGYQHNLQRAAKFSAACGILAAWFGFLACYMQTTATFIAALWMMLFVGAANVPASTGILMAVVPPSMRSAASSYANVAFNVLGYFMGPLICGIIADRLQSLHAAVHVILLMSSLGTIPLLLGVRAAARRTKRDALDADSASEDDVSQRSEAVFEGGEEMQRVHSEGQAIAREPSQV